MVLLLKYRSQEFDPPPPIYHGGNLNSLQVSSDIQNTGIGIHLFFNCHMEFGASF